jgi:hypothetical protein
MDAATLVTTDYVLDETGPMNPSKSRRLHVGGLLPSA